MACAKSKDMDLKNTKQPFPYLKKGTGLQRMKTVDITRITKKSGVSIKRKGNFSPNKDEPTKKPLVDKANTENMPISNVLGTVMTKYTSMKRELENIMPGSMKLRPRGKQTLVVPPKPLSLASKDVPNARPKLSQNNASKTAPTRARKNELESTSTKSNCNSGPATLTTPLETESGAGKEKGRLSLNSTKSDDNLLYITALEECSSAESLSDSNVVETGSKESAAPSTTINESRDVAQAGPSTSTSAVFNSRLPPGVDDIDGETWNDPFLVSCYAVDIFSYLKSREALFAVDGSYLTKQCGITIGMRALLVDWLVEVQETFELNHETLYLSVKIVDLFLSRYERLISKEKLQLIGAAAAFIASKFDERHLPTVEDFKLVCDGAYSTTDFLSMEIIILKTLDFNLGMPLSYRFLRRYSRCIKASMQVLTLARYILESSLMEYNLITRSDSKMGAAALLLALKMLNIGSWSPTLEYYSGYTLNDIKALTYELNAVIHKEPCENLKTIKNKYSHRIFVEVALVPLLNDKDLGLES